MAKRQDVTRNRATRRCVFPRPNRVGRDDECLRVLLTLINIHKPRDRSNYERFRHHRGTFRPSVEVGRCVHKLNRSAGGSESGTCDCNGAVCQILIVQTGLGAAKRKCHEPLVRRRGEADSAELS